MSKPSKRLSPRTALILASAALASVGAIDLVSGHLTVVLLYFLPIGIASWFLSRRTGLVVCFLSTCLWMVDYLRYDYRGWTGAFWDSAIIVGIFVSYSLVLSALRTARYNLEKAAFALEERVNSRTAELRITNRSLLATQERLQMALRNTPVSMYTTDRNLRYTWFYNPLFSPAENAIGKTAEFLLLPEEAARLNTIRRQIMETGNEVHEEMTFHIAGKEIHRDMFFAPFRNEAGEMEGVTTLAVDITDRKRNEVLLRNLNAALERRAEQLRNLMLELTDTEERERRRIAQILHDHLQQILVGTAFSVSALMKHIGDPEAVRIGLEGIHTSLHDAIGASRSLTAELAPPILYEKGLPEALRWLAHWMQEKYEITVDVRSNERAEELNQQLRVILFQAVRECLFNVVKHAQVKQATVTLCYGDQDTVAASVRDEGIGFDPQSIESAEKTSGGFGLFTIRERLAALGGSLKIDSSFGHGTTSTIYVPVRPPDSVIAV